MVRAILRGSKWQTRRLAKDPAVCALGNPGDLLWVKESYAVIRYHRSEANGLSILDEDWVGPLPSSPPEGWSVVYRASSESGVAGAIGFRWRSSRFMPRWASRLSLKIVGTRLQALQQISLDDIRAEGVAEYSRSKDLDPDRLNLTAAWIDLWDNINPRTPWANNPQVWAITFQQLQPTRPDYRVACNQCGWTKWRSDPDPCPRRHTVGFRLADPGSNSASAEEGTVA